MDLRLTRLAAGARDTVPMVVGAAPFGVIFGTLAAPGPMSVWHGQMMSLIVFAGASQFVALGLIAGHAGLALVWFTTLIVNLRHALYSAALLEHVAKLPLRWRWLLAYLLVDEVFAVASSFYRRQSNAPLGHWYFLGSGLMLFVTWQIWTALGLSFGTAFPRLQSLGLDFAMSATFIAIVVPQLFARPRLAAALVAGLAAWLLRDLPYKLGLLAAVFLGVTAGMAVARLSIPKAAP